MKVASRRQVVAFCLLAVSALSGCSVKLAYNNLDRLTRWAVNDYVNLNDNQRVYFDGAVADLLYWHRTEHLPRYASFLDAMQTSLADGTDERELQAMVNAILGWAEEIEARSLPIAVELMSSLSDEQVSLLARRLEAANTELVEPEAGRTVEEAQSNWADEFADRFSRFSGRLTGAQMAYLDQQSVRYIPELVLWAEYRRRWQADLLKLLEQREDLEVFGPGLASLADRREAYYGEELTAIYESNIALMREASVWLINSLAPRQQERFLRRLDDLATDLRELSDEASGQQADFDGCLVTC